jgi:DNA-directed RNA polymerase N-terminal
LERVLEDVQDVGIDFHSLLMHESFDDTEEKKTFEAILMDRNLLDSKNTSFAHQLIMGASQEMLQDTARDAKRELSEEEAEIEMERNRVLSSEATDGVSIVKSALVNVRASTDMDKYRRQVWLEQLSYAAGLEQFQAISNRLPEKIRKFREASKKMINTWVSGLQQEIENERSRKTTDFEKDGHIPFLQLLPADKIALLTVSTFLKNPEAPSYLSERQEVTGMRELIGKCRTAKLVADIGKALEREHNLTKLSDKKHSEKVNLMQI